MQQLTEVATPLLNTFLQGILGNPVARQTLQDLTVTPNLERFLQGLQNLTQITQPPIVSLLVCLKSSINASELCKALYRLKSCTRATSCLLATYPIHQKLPRSVHASPEQQLWPTHFCRVSSKLIYTHCPVHQS